MKGNRKRETFNLGTLALADTASTTPAGFKADVVAEATCTGCDQRSANLCGLAVHRVAGTFHLGAFILFLLGAGDFRGCMPTAHLHSIAANR